MHGKMVGGKGGVLTARSSARANTEWLTLETSALISSLGGYLTLLIVSSDT